MAVVNPCTLNDLYGKGFQNGFFKQLREGYVRIWVCDRLCFIDSQQAYVFRIAQQKGFIFNSSAEFEEWYKRVEVSPFPDTTAEQMIIHRSHGNEVKPLIWL